MKQIKFILSVIFITLISCSNIKNESAFDHFDPVAYIDTNEIANNYIKSYFVVSLVNDELVEMYNNTASDDNDILVITGGLILNKQLYEEGITYSYCKDSLNKVLERGISSYRRENKDTTNTISALQSSMDQIGVSFGLAFNKSTIISRTDRLLDESKSLLDNLIFSTREVTRTPNYIIYKMNVLNSNLEKYSRNIKFNFDNSWNVSTIELL